LEYIFTINSETKLSPTELKDLIESQGFIVSKDKYDAKIKSLFDVSKTLKKCKIKENFSINECLGLDWSDFDPSKYYCPILEPLCTEFIDHFYEVFTTITTSLTTELTNGVLAMAKALAMVVFSVLTGTFNFLFGVWIWSLLGGGVGKC